MFLAETAVDPETLSPGPVSFIAIALVAVLTIFLLFDMVRRLRKVNMRADINAKLDAEEAQSAETTSS